MAARPHPTKKSRCGANAPRVTAEERAKQFSENLYADGGVLFANSAIIVLTAFESTR